MNKLKKIKPGGALLSHGETPHYHRHYSVSLLSSVWSQVGPPHYRRQDNSLITRLLFYLSSLLSLVTQSFLYLSLVLIGHKLNPIFFLLSLLYLLFLCLVFYFGFRSTFICFAFHLLLHLAPKNT